MADDYIGTKEAAVRSRLTQGFIRKLIREGVIPGKKIGRDWILKPNDLDVYLATERKPGPKPLDR